MPSLGPCVSEGTLFFTAFLYYSLPFCRLAFPGLASTGLNAMAPRSDRADYIICGAQNKTKMQGPSQGLGPHSPLPPHAHCLHPRYSLASKGSQPPCWDTFGAWILRGGEDPAMCPAKSAATLPHPQGTVRLPNPDLPKVSTQGQRVVAVPRPGWCVGGQAGPGSRGGGELASEDPSQEGEPGCRAGGGTMQPALP